jgi:hypothetical protein
MARSGCGLGRCHRHTHPHLRLECSVSNAGGPCERRSQRQRVTMGCSCGAFGNPADEHFNTAKVTLYRRKGPEQTMPRTSRIANSRADSRIRQLCIARGCCPVLTRAHERWPGYTVRLELRIFSWNPGLRQRYAEPACTLRDAPMKDGLRALLHLAVTTAKRCGPGVYER